MIQCVVFGATGYAGSELLVRLQKHSQFQVVVGFASPTHVSSTIQERVQHIHFPENTRVEPALDTTVAAYEFDVAFLALSHEHSAYWAPKLTEQGKVVFDLSGAFRFANQVPYTYMADLHEPLSGNLFANPGCYPTAALIALKPLIKNGLVQKQTPIFITGMSGVSGAGRGANAKTSFCEVSIQPYGVLEHRHQPEISRHLEHEVIFTPVLIAVPRGLVVVCQVQLANPMSQAQIATLYQDSYKSADLVRVVYEPPAAHHAANIPMGLVCAQVKDNIAIVTCAIDNLLMGAATQALQAANHRFGFPSLEGIK
ncbi:MAG: N-acetyl-gamma-glutamyl-phosphate reductase ArgC [Idiomarinaceae bacterium HL-53]|nr:MAG: N-acetyl-gamma-glutamyl-phosphate reductase ArgC [Idiomarinaceae bacterium HL-53]CUS48869.1 N-acetyl-gamma-glutamyl-phosphate reductase [Idiomarinaceae bacterium HL-53]